ncbi:hypothetical protein KPL71_008418 [Citrus sinensis]|uniref:Uncharacterized protein n=1 Tax=Citrus sinensis TaxID=2711 RepID=A0ACB8M6Y7_CITSI|nr:hypothetical protein KPL71_008418 [Citrus sinensis]
MAPANGSGGLVADFSGFDSSSGSSARLDFKTFSGVTNLAADSLLKTHGLISKNRYVSAIGDPGMKSANVRVALEAWNFCNEVGFEAPGMGSPRLADCADLFCSSLITDSLGCSPLDTGRKCEVHHKVNGSDNSLKTGDKFPAEGFQSFRNPDLFAAEKERYLASLCEVQGCAKRCKIITGRNFPCFGEGCMNQPLVYHNYSRLVCSGRQASLTGGFNGTYDLDADLSIDAVEGFNGGYHYSGRGIMTKLPESPNFKVKLTLDVKHGGGPNSQFYLLDIGSCWKNNGKPCDGDTLTDVTRYSEMIINPATTSWCRPDNLVSCPPYHVSPTGEIMYRNDTSRFPYSAYHLYCCPGNAEHLEKPYDICDPYSNPQAQELVQILPHPEWAVHGYPEKQGDGWVGDARTWVLDAGALSNRLYFYQDPGTERARRVWTSLNVGTEIYGSQNGETAEWTVSDFDVLVPKGDTYDSAY